MASNADLVSTVWVLDEDRNPVSFGPGDDVPDWARNQMGEHCFVTSDEQPEVSPDKPARKPRAKQ